MKLHGARLLSVLALPWLFLLVFAVLYLQLLWPRVASGHLLAACLGIFVGLVFVSFTVAAVTFSRDVLTGRYPSPHADSHPTRP